jgi:hypothetical protein
MFEQTALRVFRLLVFFAVFLVLYLAAIAVGYPSWVACPIALVAAAIASVASYGFAVQVDRRKYSLPIEVANPTPTDRRWELKMLLRKALTAERDERWENAIALFEQAAEKADQQEDLGLTLRHIENIRAKHLAQSGL